jgi:hypothetical protein
VQPRLVFGGAGAAPPRFWRGCCSPSPRRILRGPPSQLRVALRAGPRPRLLLLEGAVAGAGCAWAPLPTPRSAARGAPTPLASAGRGRGGSVGAARGGSQLRVALRAGPRPRLLLLEQAVAGWRCARGPPPNSALRCARGPDPACFCWNRPSRARGLGVRELAQEGFDDGFAVFDFDAEVDGATGVALF